MDRISTIDSICDQHLVFNAQNLILIFGFTFQINSHSIKTTFEAIEAEFKPNLSNQMRFVSSFSFHIWKNKIFGIWQIKIWKQILRNAIYRFFFCRSRRNIFHFWIKPTSILVLLTNFECVLCVFTKVCCSNFASKYWEINGNAEKSCVSDRKYEDGLRHMLFECNFTYRFLRG